MRDAHMLGNALQPEGLTSLRGRLQQPTAEDIREVAQQFESVFVEMMLKQMRAATPGESMFGGNAEDTYRSLFDRQMALQVARGEGIGLAPMIEREMRRNVGLETDEAQAVRGLEDYRRQPVTLPRSADESAVSGVVEPGGAESAAPEDRGGATGLGGKGPAWSTPEEFVEAIGPAARRTAEKLGVPAVALVAQAALETGWGQHVIRDGEGRSSNNLFNIKAHTSAWKDESVRVPTLEYRDGIPQREFADFRVYDSVEDSFRDYADFLQRNPRYRAALEVGDDPSRFVRALQQAGYATDPRYAEKLERIMESTRGDHVRAGADVLKIPDDVPTG